MNIIELAKQAGFEVHDRKQQARVGMDALLGIDSTPKLERFAQLVRDAALEEAALVAASSCLVPPDGGSPTPDEVKVCDEAALRIRALKGKQ